MYTDLNKDESVQLKNAAARYGIEATKPNIKYLINNIISQIIIR
jgi:hypothetical protein